MENVEIENFFISIEQGNQTDFEKLVSDHPQIINSSYPSGASAGASAVLYCAYCGRKDLGRFLLEKGAQIHIHEAAAYGLTEEIDNILQDDPMAVNSFSKDGFQPLGLACFFGNVQAAKMLIYTGAEINTPSRNKMKVMPLHSSLANMNLDITRLLLENGALVDAEQSDGFTPLMAAAQVGQIEIIELLLEFRANPKKKNASGISAVDIARMNNRLEAVFVLEKD